MTVNRRFVLKGMALSGVAGATASAWTSALASPSSPVSAGNAPSLLALTNGGAVESVFLQGAMAASGSQLKAQRADRNPGFMLDFARLLNSGEAMHVIGLLDDAAATLVVDMARSSGARVQWLGQHHVEAGSTHHHLLTSDSADLCSQQFSLQLQSCEAGVSLSEKTQGGITSRQLVAPSGKRNPTAIWLSSLGYLLASPGTADAFAAAMTPTANMPINGSFVSFLIQA